MSGRHHRPLTCCDSECAGVNHCTIGGLQCEGCGDWFCSSELNEDGYCDECQGDIDEHTCKECGSFDPDLELEDGLCDECFQELHRHAVESFPVLELREDWE